LCILKHPPKAHETRIHQVYNEIRRNHVENGLIKPHNIRNNHKNTKVLLEVPRYANHLQDQDHEDESERGRSLVQSQAGWRTVMAKFIAEAQAEEAREEERSLDPDFDSDDDEPTPPRLQTTTHRPRKWQKQTLTTLFGANTKRKIVLKLSEQALQEEAAYMELEAAAEAEEDMIPDDGAIEIDDDDVYGE
jgi:hypothetical protein